MCFSKKYRKEELYVLSLYKYNPKGRNYILVEYRITTSKYLKGKRFGSALETVECLDGSSYSMSTTSTDPLVALNGKPLLEMVSIKKKKKKFTLAEIFQLQGCLNNSLENNNHSGSTSLTEDIELNIKDLF